jgi:hypothetical protein
LGRCLARANLTIAYRPTTSHCKYIQTKLNTTIQNKAYPAKINAEFNQWIRSQQYQQDLTNQPDTVGLQGYYTFDDALLNLRNKAHKPKMARDVGGTDKDKATYIAGKKAKDFGWKATFGLIHKALGLFIATSLLRYLFG